MNRKKMIFRIGLGVVAAAIVLTSLQVLFKVPVFNVFRATADLINCCVVDGSLRLDVTADYKDQVQKATGDVTISSYPALTVQRGIPVEFTLYVEPAEIDAANEFVSFPDFGISDLCLMPGENIVRFTPEESGVFYYFSRSGSISNVIMVVESLGFPVPAASVNASPGAGTSHEMPEMQPHDIGGGEATGSLGGWIEQQLMPTGGAEGIHEIISFTGWIFDRDCIGIDPVKHTKACNLMGKCYDSGLGVFEYIPGKELDSYTAIDAFLVFDGASKELATAFLRSLPEDFRDNVTVTVKGYAVNNIPASADELLVPETDNSRVDHYLTGIHAVSIEVAYIDGISTNPLPEPNTALTQP